MDEKRIQRFLLSGREARYDEHLLELFALLRGRPATEEERAELQRRVNGETG